VAAQVLAAGRRLQRTSCSPATAVGKNVAPRVAARLDVAQISRHHQVELGRHLRAPDLRRQRALPPCRSADAVKVITVRTTGFDAGCRHAAAARR
jgi:electron transfer flavoprotein alpha subunit